MNAILSSSISVIGVLEAVNKKDGVFTEIDEQYLQLLAEFVGLIVSYCRAKEGLFIAENQLQVPCILSF